MRHGKWRLQDAELHHIDLHQVDLVGLHDLRGLRASPHTGRRAGKLGHGERCAATAS